MSNVAECFRL